MLTYGVLGSEGPSARGAQRTGASAGPGQHGHCPTQWDPCLWAHQRKEP